MSECQHDLAEREGACADGMCPLCMAVELRELRSALRMLHNELRSIAVGKSGCIACRTYWLVGEPEHHEVGCLALPKHPDARA